MRWLLLLSILFCSDGLRAESLCGPKIAREDCLNKINKSLTQHDEAFIKEMLDKEGLKAFFEFLDPNGHYNILQTAQFFKKPWFVHTILARPDFNKENINKSRFLKPLLVPRDFFTPLNPEILEKLVNNEDKSKNLNWFEHAQWPFPMLTEFEKKVSEGSDKEKYSALLQRLNEIDRLKKNLCEIDSVEKLIKTEKEFSDFTLGLKYSHNDLLSCATKAGNIELASYLLKNNLYSPENLAPLVKYFEAIAIDEKNFQLFRMISGKIRELDLPLKKTMMKQFSWALDNWDKETEECLQGTSLLGEAKSFIELSEKLIWQDIKKEVNAAKLATKQKDPTRLSQSLKNIVILLEESGLSVNYQDEDGKTIVHHLAEFIDADSISYLEKKLNKKHKTMDYNILDKEGNSPLHIALLNKNLDASYSFADLTNYTQDGFFSSLRTDVISKNSKGLTPLDLVKDLKLSKEENKIKKELLHMIKAHVDAAEGKNRAE